MQEPTDDQLDGLFRKSAEEFDPPFDPAAWRDMQHRLDNDAPVLAGGPSFWKQVLRWGLPILALLLLTGGGWVVYDKQRSMVTGVAPRVTSVPARRPVDQTAKEPVPTVAGSGRSVTPNSSAAVTNNPAETASLERTPAATAEISRAGLPDRADRSTTPALDGTNPATNDATETPVSAYSSSGTRRNRTNRPRIDRSLRIISRTSTGTGRRSKTVVNASSRTRQTYSWNGGNRKRNADFSAMTYATNAGPSLRNGNVVNDERATDSFGTTPAVAADESEVDTRLAFPMLTRLTSRAGKWSGPTAELKRDVVIHPDTVMQAVIQKPQPQRGFSVRFVVSPDLSSVGLHNFSRPGTNVGLMLEYRLASRWSIQAGVLRSIKVYKATGDEYGFLPESLEKYKANLAEVSGRCSMLDIPINVRYDVLVKPREDGRQPTRWFLSGGVTSYIMNNEAYTYTYYHYYPTNTTNWSTSTGGYGLSNVNVSLGYEGAISKRLSWQVEPFMKVPVRRVGYFKIDLLSTGAFFSIRYKL